MWFPSKFKRGAGLLPTAEETFGNKYTSKSSPSNSSKHAPDTEKISSSIESSRPSLPAPVPIRTRSTQIHEPTRNPSKSTTTTAPNRNAPPQRPGLQRRRTTARTRYIDMLLGLDAVSPLHNLLASLFVWILLAGYLVLPATFNKLQSRTENISDDASVIEKEALRTVRNVPLLYVAAFACGLGVAGCIWLWWKHRGNYVWVINRIFLPALLNSIAGLVSTIVNIYSAQDGQYSVTARVTIIVTAACSAVAAGLFLLYNMVMLKRVRRAHDREVSAAERDEDARYVNERSMD